MIDWAFAIPKGHMAKRAGLIHMGLNVTALTLFTINLWMQSGKWDLAQRQPFTDGKPRAI